MFKGYVQVYTGDGKGKTTAALGLALRAAGAGLKVYIAQFIKMGDYSEIKFLRNRLSDIITVEQFGLGRFTKGNPSGEDLRIARKGLEMIRKVLSSGKYDVVIMEEANIAVKYGMFSADDLIAVIDAKPENVELVITGRHAHPRIIERADLVTEMKKIKHYFEKGVAARIGIEK
jgi:cob(I)alamin adenosyltransferase